MAKDNIITNNCQIVSTGSQEFFILNYADSNASFRFLEDSNAHILFFTKKESHTTFNVVIEGNANVVFDFIFMNGSMKDSFNFDIIGEGSTLKINTLSLAKKATKDFNITVNHMAKYSKSTVTNYGISLNDGINNYTVIGKIPNGMKDSDVRQITKGLLLSKSGQCMAKPILLIDYFDVKAYHGATIGKLSDDDLFYLMSRGLSKNEAFMLVINGMLEPFIKNLKNEEYKKEIMDTYKGYFKGDLNE